jgi:hypothetical protein
MGVFMAENVTFDNFRLDPDGPGISGIYLIGGNHHYMSGVIPEIAEVYRHKLPSTPTEENLDELADKIGTGDDMPAAIDKFQNIVGINHDAVSVARGWVNDSGLLIPVERSFFSNEAPSRNIELAVMSGGMRHLMDRRAKRLETLMTEHRINKILLVAGNRPMQPAEGRDVESMTEGSYMRQVVAEHLMALGLHMKVLETDSSEDEDIMFRGVEVANDMIDLERARVAIVSNAGYWPQDAGMFRRLAIENIDPSFDIDGGQVFAVSDEIPLGTGIEPDKTYQNPFKAAGLIVRNAEEFLKHLI